MDSYQPHPQDCQHLIQLSFAKIISSKNVKGGASLHKSLMVLHVLQKAREEQKCRSPCSSNSSDEELDQEMRSTEEGEEEEDGDLSGSATMAPLDSVDLEVAGSPAAEAGNCAVLGKRPSSAYSFDYFSNGNGERSFESPNDDQSDFDTSPPPPSLWQPKRSCFGGESSPACQSFEMCCSS